MEASNGLVFLPLLVVLELLGMKISLFPICVGDMDVATNVVLPQLALGLILEEEASLDAVRMKNGNNFRVGILLVVSVSEILLVT